MFKQLSQVPLTLHLCCAPAEWQHAGLHGDPCCPGRACTHLQSRNWPAGGMPSGAGEVLCPPAPSAVHLRDLCRPRAGRVQEAQQNRGGVRKQPGCKVLQPKPGLSCALQHLEELIKFTGTSAPRVLGAKTQNFRVNFQRHSSHLETQIRGRCLKRLWSCSCHCSTVTRFLRFLKGYGSRGAEGTKCDHRLQKLSLKGGGND